MTTPQDARARADEAVEEAAPLDEAVIESSPFRGCTPTREALTIDLDRITPDPDQPRKEFDPDSVERLARSLKARGQLMPIRVRLDLDSNLFVIIAGERRYRAAVLAGLKSLLCVVTAGSRAGADVLQDQLVENCLREDLSPVEEANALGALMGANGWSARQAAKNLHMSKPAVIKALALLDLPGPVRAQVERGALAPSVAYEISHLERPEDQSAMADRAVAERLTRAQVASTVKAKTLGPPTPQSGSPPPPSLEFRFIDGSRITLTGPLAFEGHEAIATALLQVALRLMAGNRPATTP